MNAATASAAARPARAFHASLQASATSTPAVLADWADLNLRGHLDMNTPKQHDNSTAKNLLEHFLGMDDLRCYFSRINDILVGVSMLKSEGASSTRARIRVDLLFRILQALPVITSEAVQRFMGAGASASTAWTYAAAARVASKAITAEVQQRSLTAAGRACLRVQLGPKLTDDPLDHIQPTPQDSGKGGPFDYLKGLSAGDVRRPLRHYRAAALVG